MPYEYHWNNTRNGLEKRLFDRNRCFVVMQVKDSNTVIVNWFFVIMPLCVSVFLFIPHFHQFYPIILSNHLNIAWGMAALFSLIGCYLSFKKLTGKAAKVLFFIANGLTFLFYIFNALLGMPSGNF